MQAVLTVEQMNNQMSLWNELPTVESELSGAMAFTKTVNDDMETTAHTMKLLPVSAGKGKRSLASTTGLKGEDLKARHVTDSVKLGEWMVDAATKGLRSGLLGGTWIKFTESGRVNMSFKRLKPQIKMLTDEQHAELIGCSVAHYKAFKAQYGKAPEPKEMILAPVEEEESELIPAPQNGTPELTPVKPAPGTSSRRGSKSKA